MAKGKPEEEEEPVEEEAGSESPIQKMHLRHTFKLLIVLFGIILGVLGMAMAAFFYFTVSSAISGMQSSVELEITSVYNTLGDAEETVVSLQDGISTLPPLAANLSAGLNQTSQATVGISVSLMSLAATLDGTPFISVDTASIRNSALQLSNASSSFQSSVAMANQLAAETRNVSSNLDGVRANIASSKAALVSARDSLNKSFSSLRFSALLLSLIFFFAFALLMTYSVSTIL